jgi:hypothetical protein
MPVIGYLSVGAPPAHLLAGFKQSLAEGGFIEGRNVTIETLSAEISAAASTAAEIVVGRASDPAGMEDAFAISVRQRTDAHGGRRRAFLSPTSTARDTSGSARSAHYLYDT